MKKIYFIFLVFALQSCVLAGCKKEDPKPDFDPHEFDNIEGGLLGDDFSDTTTYTVPHKTVNPVKINKIK